MLAPKKIYLVFVVLCFLMLMTCSFAADAENATADDNPTCFSNSVDVDMASLSDAAVVKNDVGTFDELYTEMSKIKSGDTYTFKKDYNLEDNYFEYPIYSKGILISGDNIVIDGNGHVIDGAHQTAIFNLNGDNITIKNLTIINGYDSSLEKFQNENVKNYNYRYSPVVVHGDNCKFFDCRFINNTGVNGGALSIDGNNAVLNNCEFINNTALGVGGAIYMLGSNSYIAYTNFTGSLSVLSGEAIYFDSSDKNSTIAHCKFDNDISYIHDMVNDMDPRYLFYSSANTNIGDRYIDIVPLLYSSIRNGGALLALDDYISYSSELRDNVFTFTINRIYANLLSVLDEDGRIGMNADYMVSRTFYFTDINTYNDVFGKLLEEHQYTDDYAVTAYFYAFGPHSYNIVVRNSPMAFTYIGGLLNGMNIVNKVLIVSLDPTGVEKIKCTNPWRMSSLDCDVVIINGNGMTIEGSYSPNNEDKWVIIDDNRTILMASNLFIKGYNNAIVNEGGYGIFNNVTFEKNKIDYEFKKDYGAVLFNRGLTIFNNCTFMENYAKYGGAIYNEGIVIVNNCSFVNNDAYGEGDNIYAVEGSQVIIDGVNITETTLPLVYFKNQDDFGMTQIWIIIGGSVVLLALITFTGIMAIDVIVLLAPWITAGALLNIGIGIISIVGAVTAVNLIIIFIKNEQKTETKTSDEVHVII